jgi:hypothetical protein
MTTEVTKFNKGSTRRSINWMTRFLGDLRYFTEAKVWDKKCADFWTFLTHTDATKFIGRDKTGIYLCHNTLPAARASEHFFKYIDKRKQSLEAELAANLDLTHAIHGDVSMFQRGMQARDSTHRSTPLTKGALLDVLKTKCV